MFEELKSRYLNYYPHDGVSEKDIKEIEAILGVKLPNDFSAIALFYSGGFIGGISVLSFSRRDSSQNIIDETIRLRDTIKLPERFIVLAEPPESLIVLDTENQPSIIWCDAVEVSRLKDMRFISKPDVWNSFSDFFAKLLKDEGEQE
ncbi:MAG: SMI1/KNR4 family protein [Firmicutes bacterium]|nr:SMI1/KNR4 family protein [Bacillota bacterium]